MIPAEGMYEKRTYKGLSHEFRELFPAAIRAFKLIPGMYNRLTLIDKVQHVKAIKKIYQDHKDLPGFSRRNIYRYLPSDNPNIPRRVVPSRHKSKILNNLHCSPKTDKTSGPEPENKSENNCPFCDKIGNCKRRFFETLFGWVPLNRGKNICLEIKQNVISLLNNQKFDWKCVLFLNTLYPNLIVIKEIIGATEGFCRPVSVANDRPSLEVTKDDI